jgi:hypothetical protein
VSQLKHSHGEICTLDRLEDGWGSTFSRVQARRLQAIGSTRGESARVAPKVAPPLATPPRLVDRKLGEGHWSLISC